MGHICSARNWCELLGFPSPFVPGTSIAVCSIGLGTVPVVRDYFTRPRPHPRPIFLSTGLLSLSTTNFFLLITFLALLLGDIWTWVTSLHTLFEFSSHSFGTCLYFFFHN